MGRKSTIATYLAILPIPFLLMTIATLWVVDSAVVYESRQLLAISNFVFSTLSSLIVLVLFGRNFLLRGTLEMLVIGCGILIWGAAGTLGALLLNQDANVMISIHNILVLISSLVMFTGAFIAARERSVVSARRLVLCSGIAATIAVVLGVVLLVLYGVTPVFFVQGEGGTVVRGVVLSLSMILFTATSAILLKGAGGSHSFFFRWFSFGILLVVTGLFGVLLQTAHGTLLNWTARLAQLLGGAYFMIAAFLSLRTECGNAIPDVVDRDWWDHHVHRMLQIGSVARIFLRYSIAVVVVVVAFALRYVIQSQIGPGLTAYITFYPCIMVALLFGSGPGIVATLLSAAVAVMYILPPIGIFAVASRIDRFGLVLFIAINLFLCALAEAAHRYRVKAKAYDDNESMREHRERLAAFAEAMFEGIVESEEGRIIDCNEQLAQMLGYGSEELKGRLVSEFIVPEDLERVMENIRLGRDSLLEHGMIRKDGMRIIVETHGRQIFPGSARRYTAVRDISEQKRAEMMLRKSEVLNRITLQSLPAHIAVIDSQGVIVTVNEAWREFARNNDADGSVRVEVGTSYTEVCRRAAAEQDADAAAALDGINAVLTGRQDSYSMEYPCHSPHEQRWFLMSVARLDSEDGAVVSHFNITALRQAEQALRESEERFRIIASNTPDHVIEQDRDLRYRIVINPQLGYAEQDMIGKTDYDLATSEDATMLMAVKQKVISTGQRVDLEVPLKLPDGSVEFFEGSYVPKLNDNGDIDGLIGYFRNVTKRKLTEAALRESETRIQQALNVSRSFTFEWMPATDSVMRSASCSAILGLAGEAAVRDTGKNFFQRVHPEDRARFVELVYSLTQSEPDYTTEYRVMRSDGTTVTLEETGQASFDESGAIARLFGVATDITTRKQMEDALARSRQDLDRAQEVGQIGWWRLDTQQNVLTWSDQNYRIFGVSAGTPLSYESFLAIVHPDDRDYVHERWMAGLAGESYDIEHRIISDGQLKWVREKAYLEFDPNGRLLGGFGITQDVSDRKAAELALQEARDSLEHMVVERTAELAKAIGVLEGEVRDRLKAEELLRTETSERIQAIQALRDQEQMMILQSRQAAMGEMIGNIAHQWRQPLNTLGLYMQGIGYFYDTPSFTREFLESSISKSMEIISYMSHTIDDFRNFFSSDRKKSEFGTGSAVNKALSLVEASFKENRIIVERRVVADTVVYGYPNEFSQVLLNILINAKDAFAERNILQPCISITLGGENGMSVVTIADNAGGIPEDIIDKIFDPYFTTKGPQQGTGVGLFMAKTIIEKKMGGTLAVCNKADGAEFRIELAGRQILSV